MAPAKYLALASTLLGAAQFVNASAAYSNATGVVYTTEVVTALTTYCPEATTLTYNSKTYTITSATTLTITDCPCTLTKPAAPTGDACAAACSAKYNKCRGSPDANFASCASEYAECLGYNPYNSEGSLVTPTACSAKPTATPTTYTEVVTAITTYCPEATTIAHNNKTYTVTSPTTLVITDCPCTITKTSTPGAPASTAPATCAAMCYDAYNKCRSSPDANMSFCAAKFSSCLGYSPFDSNGSLVTPTACSATTTATPVPSSTAPATCAAMCYDAYNKCRSSPDANMSFCAAKFSDCLGYSPFDSNGSLVTPTACSATTAPATLVPVPTASTKATPPAGVTTGPVVVPTGAAGRISPEHVLLALGAVALL